MKEFAWTPFPTNDQVVASLRKDLGINEALCKVLTHRNIQTFEEAKKFFRPSKNHLHSPWKFKHMDIAVERIIQALEKKENILLVGDYDVDGITSTTMLYNYLKKKTNNIEYHIPNRFKEGYGLSEQTTIKAVRQNVDLLITMDCGIGNVELVSAYCDKIDFIILDHHTPKDELPKAIAIVNPKQADCNYPFKHLSAGAIVFKYIQAINEKMGLQSEQEVWNNIDLVCLSIGADLVEMVDENRTLMMLGIKHIQENPRTSIKALISHSLLKQESISTEEIVFGLGPRLNALGRMGDASYGVQFLSEIDGKECLEMAKSIEKTNKKRKQMHDSIYEQILQMIEEDKLKDNKALVVFQEDWNVGILGILASRLVEQFYRPAIVLTNKKDDVLVGSARSIETFDLYSAISKHSHVLESFGGHRFAAGMTIKKQNFQIFKQSFEQEANQTIKQEHLAKQIFYYCELRFKDITNTFVNILEQMKPFGPKSLSPKFLIKNLSVNKKPRLLKEKYLKIVFTQHGISFESILFFLPKNFDAVNYQRSTYNIIAEISFNTFRGRKKINLQVYDMEAISSASNQSK